MGTYKQKHDGNIRPRCAGAVYVRCGVRCAGAGAGAVEIFSAPPDRFFDTKDNTEPFDFRGWVVRSILPIVSVVWLDHRVDLLHISSFYNITSRFSEIFFQDRASE